ncbi:hypothetical protein EGR_10600 [Echinococcus granulosus]|uniref:Uncharacterized protein n=1 Tax=Echinococcus granulosus TaxID=6210 RepID=W6U810_ECHGR|nr:hypothetical protein EGR_10600 [Echinococcus granulosus]EUB54532.1 hypothetical protein EGR_10600 [Echinococcus granulosus]
MNQLLLYFQFVSTTVRRGGSEGMANAKLSVEDPVSEENEFVVSEKKRKGFVGCRINNWFMISTIIDVAIGFAAGFGIQKAGLNETGKMWLGRIMAQTLGSGSAPQDNLPSSKNQISYIFKDLLLCVIATLDATVHCWQCRTNKPLSHRCGMVAFPHLLHKLWPNSFDNHIAPNEYRLSTPTRSIETPKDFFHVILGYAIIFCPAFNLICFEFTT